MFKTKTTFYISSMHYIKGHKGKCANEHGHNWKITVYCKNKALDPRSSMLVDFGEIKNLIKNKFDHTNLNEALKLVSVTAECMAAIICRMVNDELQNVCYRVDVEETPGCIATYEKEG